MKKTIAYITVFILILTMFSGCSIISNLADKDSGEEVKQSDSGNKEDTKDKDSDSQTLKSDLSPISVTFPGDWKDSSLVEDASIEMANYAAEKYFVIIEETSVDFADGFTYEDYAKLIMDQMSSNITDAEVSGPESVTVGNNIPAVQYELAGTIEQVKIKYLLTCFENDGVFYQALAWSLQSAYQGVKSDFIGILGSISFD